MTSPAEFAERFTAKYVVRPDGCWEWTAGRAVNGYGLFWLDGQMRGAHCYAWVRRHGPVPPGLELDHLCRNRACVNPDHLEPVTRAENIRRGDGPRLSRQRAHECPRARDRSGRFRRSA